MNSTIHISKTKTIRNFHELSASKVCKNDIATALSLQCRFSGVMGKFYSVAEHSVIVSTFCRKSDEVLGLMHDAHEAYIGDITRPVIESLNCRAQLDELRNKLDYSIFHHFSMAVDSYGEERVKMIDNFVLFAERKIFFPNTAMAFPCEDLLLEKIDAVHDQIKCLPPEKAKELFLRRFEDVHGKNG